MSKWVQHISGQGERYQVRNVEFNSVSPTVWCVDNPDCKDGIDRHLFIPRSQYYECDPPEQWEDVSAHCEVGRYGDAHLSHLKGYVYITDESNSQVNVLFVRDYRLRKVQLYDEDAHLHQTKRWAFIVERKKS